MNCDKTFKLKYHHNFVWDRHFKSEEGRNDDDDDDDDINIIDEAIEAPNDSRYHEPQPQHLNSTISHPPRSQITKASQS